MAKLPQDELTDNELDRVVTWLASHGPHPKCPWCGSEVWAVDTVLVSAPAFRKAHWRSTRQVPFVQVFSPCGYTAFFSAVTLGIEHSS
jgi:hypothetical protein